MAVDYDALETDVLVIGAGGAGARAAVEAAEKGARVLLTSKGPIARSGITPLAQMSYQCVFHPQDSVETHFQDTVKEGRYLSDQNLALALAEDATRRALDLEEYGCRFRKEGDKFVQMHLPGQTYPRSVMIEGGGHGMMLALKRAVGRLERITLAEDVMITRLLTDENGVRGGTMLDFKNGRFTAVKAGATVLAAGAHEELWPVTDCPPESTGDPFALAYHAGAQLIDMEHLLFYPTVGNYPPSIKGIIIPYEVCLEESWIGGKLLNAEDREFLPSGRLPVRDLTIRAMYNEIFQGRGTEANGLYLDLAASGKSHGQIADLLRQTIKSVYEHMLDLGIDLAGQQVDVAPAAHYMLGGIKIDENGTTSIPGLYAAGECQANVQGANRLSGNALAETQVFGARAGAAAAEYARAAGRGKIDAAQLDDALRRASSYLEAKSEPLRPHQIRCQLQRLMWDEVGPRRNGEGLSRAIAEIERMRREELPRLFVTGPPRYNQEWTQAIETEFMLDVALMVARSALMREETRGHHHREDFPEQDNRSWLKHTSVVLQGAEMVMGTTPVVTTEIKLPEG